MKSLRRWWQIKTGRYDTPFDGGAPFWFASLSFHVLLLVLLARLIMPAQPDDEVHLVIDSPDTQVFELPPELELLEEITEEFNSDLAFELPAPDEAPVAEPELEQAEKADSEIGELLADDREFFEAAAAEVSKNSTKGTVGQSASGATGAVDRITQEILLSLDDNQTLVVWMFDKSASLMQQREEILSRFDRVYEELGLLRESGNESFSSHEDQPCLLYTSPSPRDQRGSRMPSSA